MPEGFDLSFLKEHLLFAVEGSAHWRALKAADYPEDVRNQRSADALDRLAVRLAALPFDHPQFEALGPVWFEGGAHVVEEQSRFISRYGFDRPEGGDPQLFLEALREAITREMRITDPNDDDEEEDATADTGAMAETVTINPTIYAWGADAKVLVAQNATVTIRPDASQFRRLQESIDEVVTRLRERNDVSPENRTELTQSIRAGLELLKAPKVNANLVDLLLKRPLRFIADKAAGGVIGAAAMSALLLLSKYFHL